MNWKKLVETKNAKTFVLPEGWDSRDAIAEQLECSPEKVRDHLRAAINSKEVLEQRFNVWDASLKRPVMVTAYKEAKPASAVAFNLELAQRMKKDGQTWAEVGLHFGLSEHAIRAKLRRA